MSEFRALKRALKGVEPWRETIARYVDKIFHTDIYYKVALKRLQALYRRENMYCFGDAKLPLLDYRRERSLFLQIYEDTFYSYLHCNDQYDEKTFDECDKFLIEGLYGLINDKVNIRVNQGDVVIDAGSWVGDFAAYASVAGGGACTRLNLPMKHLLFSRKRRS